MTCAVAAEPRRISRANRMQCRACAHEGLSEFLNLGNMPLAGGFLRSTDEIKSERTFPLPVHVCDSCGLVQIVDPVDPNLLFRDYAFASSIVGPLVKHFTDYAQWLQDRYQPKTVVEFGCNDGILLAPLERLGVKAVGVDISENITELARGKGLTVLTGYFNPKTAANIAEQYGRCDVLTGSNAFAHNARPELILEGAARCLNADGVLVLEVMYAGDLRDKLQWDTLYH